VIRRRNVRYTIFLPYADQDHPPLKARAICRKIEMKLDALNLDVAPGTDGRRLGIIISSSKVASQLEVLAAVDPIVPDRGQFADPTYQGTRID
jgi:hypothetical protein